LGIDIADPDLIKWSAALGHTESILSFTLDGFNTPLKFTPGQGWYYGTATDWAGKLLEILNGLPISQYMEESIFKPLGIRDTSFKIPTGEEDAQGENFAPCSYRNPETSELTTGPAPVPLDNPPMESGGAGLLSTAADHARVLQALLYDSVSSHEDEGPRLVSKTTVDEMFRPQLSDVQRQMLASVTALYPDAMIPDFPRPPGIIPLDYGIGGIINTIDVPGKRKKGTMKWTGMCNGHWVGCLILEDYFDSN
jgi:CubicO group peptidase (beta-lactamase class C family)